MPPTAQPVPNYLAQAILLTLCCCVSPLTLPPGVIAIIYAAQVNGRIAAGDHAGAVAASRKAKLWCWIALGVGIVGLLASVVVFGMLGEAATKAAARP